MNLPFFFLKSLQKMSSRIKQHEDHTSQSIFHHGLIKLIIRTILHHEGKTWDFFLFWSGFHVKQEDQQPKRQTDKGKVMMKKFGLKHKLEDKEEVKAEKISEQVEEDRKPKLFSASLKGKYSLFEDKKEQPEQYLAPAENSHEEKTVDRKEIVVPKENIRTQQRSPITILSDDEGYLLEEEQVEKTTVEAETYR